ncbi:MAG TPA: S26 family signal peptidase, partial [Pirellulales bacterium]
ATGQASVWIDGVDQQNSGATSIRASGSHSLSYANVDCQLLLWVDGDLVEFQKPATYDPIEKLIPTIEDLKPARIGAQGVAFEASHLRILRDVYYIASQTTERQEMVISDYESGARPPRVRANRDYTSYLAQPNLWPELFSRTRTIHFELRADEFLMLGDNSPKSKDGRLWEGFEEGPNPRNEFYVKRDLLVGKAVFVYWPHSWNKIPGTGIPFPFFPNFARMKFVR